MRTLFLLGLALAIGGGCVGPTLTPAAHAGAHDAEIAEARKAAEAWLALADQGDGAGTYTTSAALFRQAMDEATWSNALAAARGPLGSLSKRSFATAAYQTTLPGAPDGEYVVLTYNASFANKASAVETITPMRDPDGQWRVSGYYIR